MEGHKMAVCSAMGTFTQCAPPVELALSTAGGIVSGVLRIESEQASVNTTEVVRLGAGSSPLGKLQTI